MTNWTKAKTINKRWIAAVAAAALFAAAALAGCGGSGDGGQTGEPEGGPKPEAALTAPVKVAALNGPTGIGMAQLYGQSDKYQVASYASPDEVVGKILTKEVDVAAVPSNLGAVLYAKSKGEIRLLAVNTGGVLYLLENGKAVEETADLKGKTILASGKGGAPEYILSRLLLDSGLDPEKDITVKWLANHADVASALATEDGAVALLPEPYVTVVSGKNPSVRVCLDLNQLWTDTYHSDLPMGILVATKDFVEQRAEDLSIFMADYESSVKMVNGNPASAAAIVAEQGIVADAAVAEKAIPRCNILCLTGDEARTALTNFYQILFDMQPASVGGAMPDDAYYYDAPAVEK